MAMDIEKTLLRAFAPPHLADAIVGDMIERRTILSRTLGEKRAVAVCRADALRSLPSLALHAAWQILSDNWTVALTAAALTDALCIALIPFWDRIGFGGAAYHVLRLAIIGLALGCIPRASSLSCALLLLLIGISNCAIDARETGSVWHVLAGTHLYAGLLLDGAALASMLVALRVMRVVRDVLVRHSHGNARVSRY